MGEQWAAHVPMDGFIRQRVSVRSAGLADVAARVAVGQCSPPPQGLAMAAAAEDGCGCSMCTGGGCSQSGLSRWWVGDVVHP